jgi:serine/threonine protein kinase
MPSQPARIGKYEILSQLGRGGMGVVYKARDTVIDRIVAIKTIIVSSDGEEDKNLIERLHMEARSAGRLHHPNIVTVFDYGDQDGLSYIVMEFIEGVNVARLIDEKRAISVESKLRVLVQVADGLAYAHENGVIHRDMKPSNVCVTGKGIAKILDFGLARFDDTKLTKTGYMAGTISYMSPERLSGETGIKDDIFALGAIAYELLTFRRAFPGSTAPEVMRRIISPEMPPRISQVTSLPAEIDAIIEKAMAKDVADRYESATAFSEALSSFLRSDAMRSVANEPGDHIPDAQAFVDRPSATVYVGPTSAHVNAEPPPTMRMQAEPPTERKEAATLITPVATGTPTANDVPIESSGAATQVVPMERPASRRWPLMAGGAAVVAAAVIGFVVMRQPSKPAAPATNQVVSVPARHIPRQDLVEKTELQFATARTLSETLATRPLNGDEVMRLSEARGRINLAEKRLINGDYDGGAKLLAESMSELQSVMASSGSRMDAAQQKTAQTPPVTKRPVPQPKTDTRGSRPQPVTVAASKPIEPQPQPQPQPVTVPQKAPDPQPTAPAPRQDPPEAAERQVASFMSQLAAAYQSKDVGFFREHSLRFTDQLANAIRNSPSVRVQLHVTRTDFADATHASVHVRRTDWFADAGAPPATQNLVYGLTRTSEGWQLASIARD